MTQQLKPKVNIDEVITAIQAYSDALQGHLVTQGLNGFSKERSFQRNLLIQRFTDFGLADLIDWSNPEEK